MSSLDISLLWHYSVGKELHVAQVLVLTRSVSSACSNVKEKPCRNHAGTVQVFLARSDKGVKPH